MDNSFTVLTSQYNDGYISVICPGTTGCTDINALNYDSTAICDDGSCCYISGCSDINALNYDSLACFDDGSCCLPTFSQIGNDIFGDPNSSLGRFTSISLSDDGNFMAVGSSSLSIVRIYQLVSNNWVQIGQDILGLDPNNSFGWSISISGDGNTLIASSRASNEDPVNPAMNKVRVFENVSGNWTQIGSTLFPPNSSDDFGFSVSINYDGSVIVIGSRTNNSGIITSGLVEVYENISNSWFQIGNDIYGDGQYDNFGFSVSIDSTGNIIAIGARYDRSDPINTGYVKIYENISGSWLLIGNKIKGQADNDQFGWSVSINSNGNVVAIGAPYNNNNYNFGQVSIYENISNNWALVGYPIYGNQNSGFGRSVSINNLGNIVAVGSPYSNPLNPSYTNGIISVYENFSNFWLIKGQPISLENYSGSNANFGSALSISGDGNKIAGTAQDYILNGSQVGLARVYDLQNLCFGCTDSAALNFEANASFEDSTCFYLIYGCTDSTALNFDLSATVDDSSCIYCNYGCTDSLACNYDSLATCDDGSCLTLYGCTDSLSCNYDPLAQCDDGSCLILYGCTDSLACNYDPLAQCDDGSCLILYGCMDSLACNYDPFAQCDDGSCLTLYGCMDSSACNYDPLAQCDDGNCLVTYGCTDSLAFNFYPGAQCDDGSCLYCQFGCMDPSAFNYDSTATCSDSSCIPIVFGCIDSLALNYNSLANTDDGSCSYAICYSPKPTGLYVYDLIDIRAKIGWDNMNDSACMVWKYYVRYREVGTSGWTTKSAGVGNGLCNFGLNTVTKQLLNLNPSTNYEFKMKAFYCGGTSSNYSAPVQFTTKDPCPDMTNLTTTTFNGNQAKVRFNWDTTGTYVFARILLRVDTAGSLWQTAGGFGVYYPQFFVNKFGLTPGQSYRAQGRTFCDSNITAYRSPTWSSPPVFWTQPGSLRNSGGRFINNLNIYPNPSRNIFNISFNSDVIQNLRIRIINLLGKELYLEEKQKFIGQYSRIINLDNYEKGIYFLEIENNTGVINKKLILQ